MPMGTYPLHPALSSRVERLPEQVHVVIAGSGIMGCATAWQLAGQGLSVLVLDKAGIASQQSTRAWGFVRQQARDPADSAVGTPGRRTATAAGMAPGRLPVPGRNAGAAAQVRRLAEGRRQLRPRHPAAEPRGSRAVDAGP